MCSITAALASTAASSAALYAVILVRNLPAESEAMDCASSSMF